jgi:hypothetical protein
MGFSGLRVFGFCFGILAGGQEYSLETATGHIASR